MSVIGNMDFISEDSRKRKYLLPKKIVEKRGIVENSDALLRAKPLQIGLHETDFCTVANGESGENSYIVLDFGVEMQGGIRILNFESAGDKYPEIRLTFGESLTEALSEVGENGATNDHAVRQFTVPLPALSDQDWGNTGFRFVKVELISRNASISVKNIYGIFVYRDYEYKGTFRCDDDAVNKIYDISAYTCHLCCQNMLWDGIKRDRLVWIGDMMPESMTVRDVFGDVSIVEESLDFVKEQTELPSFMNGIMSYSLWWICILKDLYMYSGNLRYLSKQKDYLSGLLDILRERVRPDGHIDYKEDWVFLDWASNDNPAKANAVTGLFKAALSDGAFLLCELGEDGKAKETEILAHTVTADKNHGDSKQIAAMMFLTEVSEDRQIGEWIAKGGADGFSAFTSYFILKTLKMCGRQSEAIRLMKMYYLDMIRKGATAFWEDYDRSWGLDSGTLLETKVGNRKDIHADYGNYCYRGLRHSLCHGWASGAVPFLTECVLGVNILKAGCKKLEIKPDLGSLSYAIGTFPTPFGTVKIRHEKQQDGTVKTEVTAPKEIEIIY